MFFPTKVSEKQSPVLQGTEIQLGQALGLVSCPTGLVQSEDQNTKTAVGRAKVTERVTETPPAMATAVI